MLIRDQAERAPERLAVQYPTGSWTYRQLITRADQISCALRQVGVRQRDRIGIYLGRSGDLVATLLGVLQLGCAYVPLEPEYPPDRIRFMGQDSGLAALVSTADQKVPTIECPVVHIDRLPATHRARFEPADSAAVDIAYVIYTSGSTGTPKGVAVRHRGVANIICHSRAAFEFTADDAVLALASFSFDFAQLEILLPLISGGVLHLVDRAVARDSELLGVALAERKVTFLMGTPSMFRALLALGWRASNGLTIVSGGETLESSTVSALRPARIWNIYGPTETSIYSLAERVDEGEVTLGRPVTGTVVEIMSNGERCPDNQIGEIHIGGVGLAIGYHNRPKLTAERFVPDPLRPGERIYRTGDLAYRRPDGRIAYVGRNDDQVKIRGNRVEVGEVERQLLSHPDVTAAAVVAEESHHSLRLVAYVVTPDGTDDTSALREFLGHFLPAFSVPSRITRLPEMPVGPNGKVDRQALKELSRHQTITSSNLSAVWRETLGLAEADPNQDFFTAGGDSLSAMELVARARGIGILLRPADIYAAPTLKALSALGHERLGAGGPQDTRSPVSNGVQVENGVLSPAQLRFLEWGYDERDHYNVSMLLAVEQPVDRAALCQALQMLADRHEALRLRLADGTGPRGLVSVTASGETVRLSWHTQVRVPPAERDAIIETEADKLHRSLSLTDGPVWRAAFFEGERQHRLLLVFHHFVTDGASLRIIARDLSSGYEQACARRTVDSPATSWVEHAAGLHRLVNGPLGRVLERTWARLPWAEVRPLPLDDETGSMDVRHVRSIQTTLQVPSRVSGSECERLLIAAIAKSIAEETGGSAVAIDVCRHGRTDVTGRGTYLDTVGWLNSVAPYVLDVSDAEAECAPSWSSLFRQIDELRDMEATWGALRFQHDDAAVRQRMVRLGTPDVYLNYLGAPVSATVLDGPFHIVKDSVGVEMTLRRTQPYRLKIHAETSGDTVRVRWSFSADVHRQERIRRIADSCMSSLRRHMTGEAP